jgi:hypothetical protein
MGSPAFDLRQRRALAAEVLHANIEDEIDRAAAAIGELAAAGPADGGSADGGGRLEGR